MSLSNFRMSPSPSVTLGEYKQRKTTLKAKFVSRRGTLFYHLDSHIVFNIVKLLEHPPIIPLYWPYHTPCRMFRLLRNKDDHQVLLRVTGLRRWLDRLDRERKGIL